MPENIPFSIIYQDDSMMVINKPPGLVMEPTITHSQKTLAEILTDEFDIHLDRGGIVHRLDKDTSGLLLVAKTQPTLDYLQDQFRLRTVKKEYTALVHGTIKEGGVVKVSVGRNPGNREKFTVFDSEEIGEEDKEDPTIRESETQYQPDSYLKMSDETLHQIFFGFNNIQFRKLKNLNYQNYTLVKCYPLTGRTHQIRIHLKYINFPIVGDNKYGGRKVSRLDQRWCKRQFLHASKISFNHPVSKDQLTFESPLATDLLQVLTNLKQVDL